MHVGSALFAGLCAAALGAKAARAQTGPVIALPGKPGVPVTINGVIVDGAVIYGDWGLARPGHGQVIVVGPVTYATPWDLPGYYPKTGRRPRSGRHEIDTPSRHARPP